MESYQEDSLFLLLDSTSAPLARGKLESPADAPALQMRVLDNKVDIVAQHEVIQMVSMGHDKLAIQCQLVRQRGDRVVLNRVVRLDSEFQRNLRVPVRFKSFIYPISGTWKGRLDVQSVDLSCGGIAFYGKYGLENGEELEIVVPITLQPLVLRCEILRQQSLRDDRCFYAAKFVDLCSGEESMVREAVFRVQLQDRPRQAEANNS